MTAIKGENQTFDRAVQTLTGGDDLSLLHALRNGDEAAFVSLFERYHRSLVRLAMGYVSGREVAEEVAQEAWLGLLKGIGRFEGRSSVKTWLFRILVNRAKTRGKKEGRSLPFSDLSGSDNEPSEPAVEPERFLPHDHSQWPNHWSVFPNRWDRTPEDRLLSQETFALIRREIEALAPNQRMVVTLRDMEGWTSEEVCNVLEITETNQRVLLHRARSRLRRAVEKYFDQKGLSKPTEG